MKEATKRLGQLLRRKQALDFASIKAASGGRSRRSLFRDLSTLGYLTSYTHGGCYYTLTEIPQFDEHGLWFFQGVGFSRVESLKATLVERVDLAEAGHTHRELEELLHIRVHNTLLGLVRDRRIDRERIKKLYVYVSAQAKRASEQVARRRTWMEMETESVTEMPVLTVIEVLLEVVRAGKMVIAPAVVAERLRVRGVSVTAAHVEQVFARYELEVSKKRPRSRSRR
jgi:hypothetical protein